MKNIFKFESFNTFNIDEIKSDLKDICLDITDDGYKVTMNVNYISNTLSISIRRESQNKYSFSLEDKFLYDTILRLNDYMNNKNNYIKYFHANIIDLSIKLLIKNDVILCIYDGPTGDMKIEKDIFDQPNYFEYKNWYKGIDKLLISYKIG